MHFPHVRFALLHWLLCDRCAANVATVGGRSKPERLYAFSACAFCVGALATCDHCAADVAALGGRSKPERLYAFCACAFCIGGLATCDHCAANVAALGGRNKIVERDTLKTFVECQSACLRVEFNTSDVFSWIVNARFWFHVDVPASNAFNFDCGSNEANRYEQGLARK